MSVKIKKSDKLFSQFIRGRAGWKCERCFKQYQPGESGLHCSHFYGRAKKSVRWDPENASAHCHGCHAYLTAHPNEHVEWKKKTMTPAAFQALTLRANTPAKVDEKAVEIFYTKLLEPKQQ